MMTAQECYRELRVREPMENDCVGVSSAVRRDRLTIHPLSVEGEHHAHDVSGEMDQ